MAMGCAPEVIQEAQAAMEDAPRSFGVWPCNWHALQLFVLMADQWRMHMAPMGGVVYQGLDLSALPVPMAAARRRVEAEHRQPVDVLLQQLQAMVAAARPILNAR